MGYARTAANTIRAQTTWACSDCPILPERSSHLEKAVERAIQSAALASSNVKDLRVRLLSALVARAPPPVRHPTCGDILVAWRNGSMLDDRDGPEIEAIAASILLRSSPEHQIFACGTLMGGWSCTSTRSPPASLWWEGAKVTGALQTEIVCFRIL